MSRICRSEINKLAKDIYTLTYAPTVDLVAERVLQLAKGGEQSVKLLTAIEQELKIRQADKQASITDFLS